MAQKRLRKSRKCKAKFGLDFTSSLGNASSFSTGLGDPLKPGKGSSLANSARSALGGVNNNKSSLASSAFDVLDSPIDVQAPTAPTETALGGMGNTVGMAGDVMDTVGSAIKYFGRENVKPVQTEGLNEGEAEIAKLNASETNSAADEAAAREMATNALALGATAAVGPLGGMAVKAGEGLSNMIKGDSEEGSNRSLIGNAMSVSGKTGIADFTKGNYGMGFANLATGGAAGVVDEYFNGADRAKESELKRRKLEDHVDALSNRATTNSDLQKRVFAEGTEGIEQTKEVEVEKDEIVMRRDHNGRFTKVADFKGGRSHMQGGEDYIAKEGDVIFPGHQRRTVDRMIRQHDHTGLETMRMKLPKDTVKSTYANGTDGIKTNPWEGMSQADLKASLVGLSASNRAKVIAAYNRSNKASTKKLGYHKYPKGDPNEGINVQTAEESRLRNYNIPNNTPTIPKSSAGGFSSGQKVPDWIFDTGTPAGKGVENKNIDAYSSAATKDTPNEIPNVEKTDIPTVYYKNGMQYIKNDSNGVYYNSKGSPDFDNIATEDEGSLSSYHRRMLKNHRAAGGSTTPSINGRQVDQATYVNYMNDPSSYNQNMVEEFNAGDWARGNYLNGGTGESFTPEDVNNPGGTTTTTTGGTGGGTKKVAKRLPGITSKVTGTGFNALADTYEGADFLPTSDEEVFVESGKSGENSEKGGILSNIKDRFNAGLEDSNLLDYASPMYNIAKGAQAPEQVDRTYLQKDANKIDYRDMSDPARRKALELSRINAANAGATSGGVAGVSGARKASSNIDYMNQLIDINSREIGRADAIATQNAQMNAGVDSANVNLKNQYEDLDARNRAVPDSYTDRGVADIAKIRSQQRLDARKNKYQDMVVGMIGTNNFKIGGDRKKGFGIKLT